MCHIVNMRIGDLAYASAQCCPEGAWSPRMSEGAWNIVYASVWSFLEGTWSPRMSEDVRGASRM